MAFRADEAESDNLQRALAFLIPRELTGVDKRNCHDAILDLREELGPVVDTYPYWHPLLAANNNWQCPAVGPSKNCGYLGLDHTVLFANGFVSCPYHDGHKIIDSVNALPLNSIADIEADFLGTPLYATDANPIVVRCKWLRPINDDKTIPKNLAVPLMLEQEFICWRDAQFAETWETMRPYMLGQPHGSRSSLSVNQETGQALKKIYNAIIHTGMFGPIKV